MKNIYKNAEELRKTMSYSSLRVSEDTDRRKIQTFIKNIREITSNHVSQEKEKGNSTKLNPSLKKTNSLDKKN